MHIEQTGSAVEGVGKVLEISGEKGAVYSMFNEQKIEYTPTSYPDVNVEALPFADNTM